jgi:hypothetical protein
MRRPYPGRILGPLSEISGGTVARQLKLSTSANAELGMVIGSFLSRDAALR